MIYTNLELATKFLGCIGQTSTNNILDKRKVQKSLEGLLTFLSCFFGNNFEFKPYPHTLQFKLIHYLQNLYGCGLEEESKIRNSYYKFVNLLLSIDGKLRGYIGSDRTGQNNDLLEWLHMRVNCFLINFLEMDWELYDWKFLSDSNIGYLMRNTLGTMPIAHYVNDKSQSSCEVLEEAFSLSREVFDKRLAQIDKSG